MYVTEISDLHFLINNIFYLKVPHLVICGVVESSVFHTKFSKNSNKN